MTYYESLDEELTRDPKHADFRKWLKEYCGYTIEQLHDNEITPAYMQYLREQEE